jgi:uncharacterized protein YndB with AHSA1/START domain
MDTQVKTVITVENLINAPVEKVWRAWSTPDDITKWCSPSDEWHTPRAENDLQKGGRFLSRMEAKDGSMGFDFGGVYNEVRDHEYIEYTIDDNRNVKIYFTAEGDKTRVVETFEAETMNSVDMQRAGWQAILDSFKKYTEELAG